MKLIKVTITIFVFLFTSQILIAQKSEVKKQLSELFFEIPHQASKYDIRKLINSENFKEIKDGEFAIGAEFDKNLKLSYLTKNYRSVNFFFDENSSISNVRKLYFDYLASEKDLVFKQLDEIASFFKGKCYKFLEGTSEDNERGGVDFYSNKENFENKKRFLSVGYRHWKYDRTDPDKINEGYILEVFYWAESFE